MSLRLRPLRDNELDTYAELSRQDYARTLESQAGAPREHALEKARTDLERLWPDGRPGAGQLIFRVEDEETGQAYGYLWLAEREISGRRVIWIYDVSIDERFRGRGLGRETMRLAEAEAKVRGLDRIDLNVFGGNDVARGLYRSLGYEELTVWMGKNLE